MSINQLAMYDHEIDPSGDAVITLRPSKAPFAVWKPRPAAKDSSKTNILSSSKKVTTKKKKAKRENQLPTPPESDSDAEPEAGVRFLVSSRHLTSASRMIKAMLSTSSGWSEVQKDEDGLYQIEAEDWDETAFSIVLNVIHCRYRKVPETVELEMLAKIAVIVDYYQVHEAMVLASRAWLEALTEDKLPTKLNRDLCLWLTAASVFAETDIFRSLTKVAILQSWKGMKFPVDLPIPSGVIGEYLDYHDRIILPCLSPLLTAHLDCIKKARDSSMQVIISKLRELLEEYVEGRKGCSFECTAIHLGVLTLKLRELNIDDSIVMEGTTIEELMKELKEMQSPQWARFDDGCSRYIRRHSCQSNKNKSGSTASVDTRLEEGTLNRFAAQLAQSVTNSLAGLELSDFAKVRPENDMLF